MDSRRIKLLRQKKTRKLLNRCEILYPKIDTNCIYEENNIKKLIEYEHSIREVENNTEYYVKHAT